MELQEENIILKRRFDSTNNTIIEKDAQIQMLQNLNTILEAEKKQWVQMKTIQEQIIQQTLDRANELNNRYLEEIQLLKKEICELKG